MINPYNIDLDKNIANYQPLTPISFLERAADVFPNHTAIIHGSLKQTYSNFYTRSKKLASALSKKNILRGHTVSTLLLNTPAMLEAHYGIPMCGAVIHAINTRLDAKAIAFQLDHADSKILIFDKELLSVVNEILSLIKSNPILIQYNDNQCNYTDDDTHSDKEIIDYENFIETGDNDYQWLMPEDEWDAISVGYTSGTTGNPKGVVSHHRGAYLLAQGNALVASMNKHSVYLWTLPMFHCNGWCFPWTMSAIIGTHVCLRQVRAEAIWSAMQDNLVTHLCGAPIIMSVILSMENKEKFKLNEEINFFTAAAPPPESVLADMKQAGFNVTHLYGLTETYGPAVINEWHSDWNALDASSQAILKARQGVRYLPLEGLAVLDPKNMKTVPSDGKTIGEVMFRGNIVMKGYLKNKKANDEAFADGWFHSGDLAVLHEDGYIQLKDRSKDIIISGGENISSIEIEEVLSQHPLIISAAVVAIQDEKWGESPCAFIEIGPENQLTEQDALNWCKEKLAGFKVPKKYIFESIPRTSTGKIQKYILRKRAELIFSSKK
ncbi:MAG: acyl-CoA synthetase [Alphaproteobacteria bacterium]|jgi:fatty-acyl-CoA synthase|nr:acyl-CoA synthetase [Alphaproteobacteria bacterium]